MRYFFILLSIIFSIGCDSGDLGKNYYYLSDSEAGELGYPYGSILYRSSEKYLYEKIIIYNRISKVSANDRYILVCQEPDKLIMKRKIIDDISFWKKKGIYQKESDTLINFPHGKESLFYLKNMNPDLVNNYVDSLFKNNSYYIRIYTNKINYWLIEKFTDSLIGPLNSIEFEQKRKEFNISGKLN